MYNLLVDSDTNSWDGDPHKFARDRCLRVGEATDSDLAAYYGSLSSARIAELRQYPCIFAYENGCNKDPKFGFLRDVSVLRGEVRIEYNILPLDNFITASKMREVQHLIDIKRFELNRTHWAVKKVDLYRKLRAIGIRVPGRPINIDTHQFDVALSFPGESRDYVKDIAENLNDKLDPDSCFYDGYYRAQLSRPDLDVLLQNIYRSRSKLIVVFLGHDYQKSEWCGIEFRSVRDILKGCDRSRIMYVRMDDGAVEGVMPIDGYIDARQHTPEVVAQFIHQRVLSLS